MISERDAARVYSRDTPVIRKGEAGWTSDNHHEGRRGEKYMINPTSAMVAHMQRMKSAQVDTSSLESITATAPIGTTMEIPDGRDLVTVELREKDGERYWHTRFRSKNGAL